jgi:DNA modification methylase
VVTDPPYGLEFMGKEWDAPWKENGRWNDKPHGEDNQRPTDENGVSTGLSRWTTPRPSFAAGLPFQQWCQLWATECLRVLKPGGHLLAFGGTRTWHRLACAVEDAGFEVRDSIAWLYGSGFPKSLDVSKAIDKHLTPRDLPDLTLEYRFTDWARSTGVTSRQINEATDSCMGGHYLTDKSQPAIPTRVMLEQLRHLFVEVPQWVEEIVDQREREKAEASERQAAARFLETLNLDSIHNDVERDDALRWQGWGTALKPAHEPIVVARKPLVGTVAQNVLTHGTGALNIADCRIGSEEVKTQAKAKGSSFTSVGEGQGFNGCEESTRAGRWPANVVLDGSQAAALDAQSGALTSGTLAAHHQRSPKDAGILGAYGSAEGERGYGDTGGASRFFYVAKADRNERPKVDGVAHPTVKPLDLMRWLVRLVTPPGGTVLEPFAGSGTTVEACIIEGFQCIAIEKGDEHLPLIESRITRRRDPVRHVELTGADPGLFDFLGGEAS